MISLGLLFAIFIIGLALGSIILLAGIADTEPELVIIGLFMIIATFFIVGIGNNIISDDIEHVALADLYNYTIDINMYNEHPAYKSAVDQALIASSINNNSSRYTWKVIHYEY
jgi:hypothetical protein